MSRCILPINFNTYL